MVLAGDEASKGSPCDGTGALTKRFQGALSPSSCHEDTQEHSILQPDLAGTPLCRHASLASPAPTTVEDTKL